MSYVRAHVWPEAKGECGGNGFSRDFFVLLLLLLLFVSAECCHSDVCGTLSAHAAASASVSSRVLGEVLMEDNKSSEAVGLLRSLGFSAVSGRSRPPHT